MRANRGKILLNVFLLMLLFLSFTPWFPQPPLTQIAQLEDGSVFLLSDYFDFAWDDVEVLNTFSRLTREQYDALIDAGWLDSSASPNDRQAQAVLAFYRDGILCKLKLYDYSDQSVPIFCQQVPDPSSQGLPTDHFAASRESARFEVLSSTQDGETVLYAVLTT